MPRKARLVVPGYPHHVTQRGGRRQRTFFSDSDYRAYLRLLTALKGEARVDILAYCLMPNHIHAVAVPRNESGLARLFGPAHQRYARRVNKRRDWRGHLWQERFYSCVMEEGHLLAAVRYIELNPVRAGLCNRPNDWPWSSFHVHIGAGSDSLVAATPTLEEIGDWESFLEGDNSVSMTDEIRKHTRTGQPLGTSEFIDKLEALTGKRLRRRKPGPRPGLTQI